ncbi:membrane-bound serine protease (ClpP class) [Bernardetia litoralis DSM 6794]|uniref:Membrane-bound serine protease (ClpP class) n=1 Tax=Bernardetia litoralis (strain ATCC 23117 / DSM 6794 / NBRC 15988 / NCIMB 1366 / Fx l1 / Sio-4) TaxID=880071 RepID=I4AQI3_BERLS|nr:NfeD family protein [Bernardetia litoralis]AFM06218.1 membrane-bound serine protease (ClpP class) [Bernardetia litoralis DSM 6794]
MELFLIGILFFFAMITLIIEILSGTIKFGVISLFLTLLGTALTYFFFGIDASMWTLSIAFVFNIGAITYSVRSKSWEKFSQKQMIESKHDDKESERKLFLYPEQRGKTISSLRPNGRVSFDGEIFEVRSVNGQFIDTGKEIMIIKIESAKIYVAEIPLF